MKRMVMMGLLAFLAATAFSACKAKSDLPPVLTGLVDATEIDVASKIPGRIKELAVKEGDQVKEGDKLLVIESEEILAKMDQASAAIGAAQAKLKMARHGARVEEKKQAKKALEAAQQQAEITRKMHDRLIALREKDAVSQAKFDEVEFQFNVAQAQLGLAQARVEMVENGARSEEIEALEQLVKQGEGVLSEVKSYSKEMVQNAPITGEVSKIILHKGELAATGYPIITLVDMSDIWAAFSVREDLLKSLAIGQDIKVQIPALGKTATMKVFHIAPLGDFATWRATSDKNSFDLKTFEVKVRPTEPIEGLRPGMSVRWSREG